MRILDNSEFIPTWKRQVICCNIGYEIDERDVVKKRIYDYLGDFDFIYGFKCPKCSETRSIGDIPENIKSNAPETR